MNKQSHPPGFQAVRRDRLLQEEVHDSYRMKGKLHEPSYCAECGAVYHQGRWQWLDRPEHAHETHCPACLRIHDGYPAGYVSMKGDFLNAHEQEIRQLISNHEEQEKTAHPLQRIMGIERSDDGITVTTTDIHLARGIGDAVHHAYRGELDFHYNPEQNLLRVTWAR